jgi:hypothetical protein
MICDPSRLDQLVELGRHNLANQPSVLWAEPSPTESHGCSRITSQLCVLLCVFSLRALQLVSQRVHLKGASLISFEDRNLAYDEVKLPN